MKQIELSKGFFAKVDDADYDWLNQWNWHVNQKKKGLVRYAHRGESNGKGGL